MVVTLYILTLVGAAFLAAPFHLTLSQTIGGVILVIVGGIAAAGIDHKLRG